MEGASASRQSPMASSIVLAMSTGRPPRPPMARPIHGDTSPATSSPSDRPPITQVSGQPVSWTIGLARTAGK